MTDLFAKEKERQDLLDQSIDFPSWTLTPRQMNDLEMLIIGAFAPLDGFMNEQDYVSVLKTMRTTNSILFPIPIYLDVTEIFAESLNNDQYLSLRDPEGLIIAILEIKSIYKAQKKLESRNVYQTDDLKHPAVEYLFKRTNNVYLGGKVIGINKPRHFDFVQYRQSPAEVKEFFKNKKNKKVVAFQTRNPLHRAHFEILKRAQQEVDANVLIHPVVGLTKQGDINHFIRTKCYKEIIKKFPEDSALLSLLPLAMRMGGPKEALLHAIIRKNYGVTHFIVGRDHAGPGKDSQGNDFYGPYDAQELVKKYQDEIGITMMPFKMQVYVKNRDQYIDVDKVKSDEESLTISGTELREILRKGSEIPSWFTFPEISLILKKAYLPSNAQGFTIFFTGLSGAGKSTIANGVMAKLLENTSRSITLLDGDLVRQNLSSELGFSKEHRNLNINRIAYVASEITKHNGIAICAPIAPYLDQRLNARSLIESHGKFIEVFVSTTFEQCESRDVKGLYAKARKGLIKGFTGLDDPYERPDNPEITVDGASKDPKLEVNKIISYLKSEMLID